MEEETEEVFSLDFLAAAFPNSSAFASGFISIPPPPPPSESLSFFLSDFLSFSDPDPPPPPRSLSLSESRFLNPVTGRLCSLALSLSLEVLDPSLPSLWW